MCLISFYYYSLFIKLPSVQSLFNTPIPLYKLPPWLCHLVTPGCFFPQWQSTFIWSHSFLRTKQPCIVSLSEHRKLLLDSFGENLRLKQ